MKNAVKSKLQFDFIKQWLYHQRQRYILKRQPFARALGLRPYREKRVLDATCGTGKDALLMLAWGAQVEAFERMPSLASSIEQAIGDVRIRKCPSLEKALDKRFCFRNGDARLLGFLAPPDVIYYDPMYEKKRGPLPRKDMQIVRQLVGEREGGGGGESKDAKDAADTWNFFQWARGQTPRLVVKRPLKGQALFSSSFSSSSSRHHIPPPTVSYRGKSTRYDVYIFFNREGIL